MAGSLSRVKISLRRNSVRTAAFREPGLVAEGRVWRNIIYWLFGQVTVVVAVVLLPEASVVRTVMV
jgi:hypothetical protein